MVALVMKTLRMTQRSLPTQMLQDCFHSPVGLWKVLINGPLAGLLLCLLEMTAAEGLGAPGQLSGFLKVAVVCQTTGGMMTAPS